MRCPCHGFKRFRCEAIPSFSFASAFFIDDPHFLELGGAELRYNFAGVIALEGRGGIDVFGGRILLRKRKRCLPSGLYMFYVRSSGREGIAQFLSAAARSMVVTLGDNVLYANHYCSGYNPIGVPVGVRVIILQD